MEYGLSYIIYCIGYYIAMFLFMMESTATIIAGGVLMIAIFWFILAQGTKRCHDRDNSGWFQLIPFYVLWMLFGDGDACENAYGDDPKGREMTDGTAE